MKQNLLPLITLLFLGILASSMMPSELLEEDTDKRRDKLYIQSIVRQFKADNNTLHLVVEDSLYVREDDTGENLVATNYCPNDVWVVFNYKTDSARIVIIDLPSRMPPVFDNTEIISDMEINLKEIEEGNPQATMLSGIDAQKAYIQKYAEVAMKIMMKYKIPASITLAQAILESDAGRSTLARKCNNHFGIKCFSRRCSTNHCMNFPDDHHKDFFRNYDNVMDSYTDRVERVLKKDRYSHLYALGTTDYIRWAKGLQQAGYATDKRYADKLVNLIETHGLQQYDK